MAAKRLTTEEFIRRVKEKFGDKFTFEKTAYTTKNTGVVVTCGVHGDISVNPDRFIRFSSGCSRCTGSVVTEADFIARSREVFGDVYDYSKIRYKNTSTKVEVVCRKHGPFFTVPYSHYANKAGCMKCFWDRKLLTLDEFIAKAKAAHGERYDYSMTVYRSGSSLVEIGCPIHGIFLQKPRVHADGAGCTQCFLDRYRSNSDEFIKKAKVIHGERYDYSRVRYAGNKTKVEVVCRNHGSFWVTPNCHLTGPAGCSKCRESKGETRIRVFLEKHGLEHTREYKTPPFQYRFDFYIPKYKMLIEHHGHQHFKPVELFGGMQGYLERVKNDEIKRDIARQHGYYLVETDFRLMEKNGIEIALEMALSFRGHVFEKGSTITNNTGPRITEM